MNKFQLCLFVLLLVFAGSCKKDLLHYQKVQKLTSNTTNTIDHIHFITNNICIAAGGNTFYESTILLSFDGGYTWSASSSPLAPKQMYGMGTSPNGNIYLSGIDGDILHSEDSGQTWQFNRIEDWLVYRGGYFPVKDTGIFVSTVLERQCTITRVDTNFNILDEQTYLFGVNNIYPAGQATSYLIGYGTVMKTTDNGNTWNFQDVKGDNFMAMDMHGEEIWMCGYIGSIYHTANGGATWQRLRNGNDITLPRYNLLDILFTDEQNGWAICDNGKVIRSDDGGQHWEEYDQFTTSALRCIARCPNGDLLVAGDNGNIFRISTQ